MAVSVSQASGRSDAAAILIKENAVMERLKAEIKRELARHVCGQKPHYYIVEFPDALLVGEIDGDSTLLCKLRGVGKKYEHLHPLRTIVAESVSWKKAHGINLVFLNVKIGGLVPLEKGKTLIIKSNGTFYDFNECKDIGDVALIFALNTN